MQTPWLVLDPNTHGGVFLASDLNAVMPSLLTNHLGAARPAYAVAGMTWAKQVSPTVIELYLFDGADDIKFGTFDTASNAFTASGVPQGNPPGAIIDYAGLSAPTGWLLCFGQAISRVTFSALFSAIGVTYGAGDSVSTFNVPDLRGRVIAGVDNMGGAAAARLTSSEIAPNANSPGATGGSRNHTLTLTQIPSHSHPYTRLDAVAGGTQSGTGRGGNSVNTGSAGGNGAHPIVQPTIMLNKLIKT